MTHELGDGPVEPEYLEKMQHIAMALDELFNGDAAQPRRRQVKDERTTGFVLMVYRFGDEEGRRCNYISNGADRRDVVTLMKEMIARFEGQPEMKGTA